VTAHAENPNGHLISLMAYFEADSIAVDSAALADDALHGDGASGDGVWGTSWKVPAGERFYNVELRVADPVDPSTYSMPYAARFATAGPLIFDGYSIASADTVPNPGDQVWFRIKLKNIGSVATIPAVTARVMALDSGNIAGVSRLDFGSIDPSASVRSTNAVAAKFSPVLPGLYSASFAIDISSTGTRFWRDTMRVVVTGIAREKEILPAQFALKQNYPNPFNPSTTIKYELPKASHVTLTVYDLLGREVARLVNDLEEPGYKTVEWNGGELASGVYFYRLQAGDCVQTRKLLVLR